MEAWIRVATKALIGTVLYILSVKVTLPPKIKPLDEKAGDQIKDFLSMRKIHLLNLFGMVVFTGMFFYYLFSPDSLLTQPWSLADALCALVSFFGSLLRLWSFRTLGELFTFQVSIRRQHKLVTSGPYRWLLHPSYTGAMASHFAAYGYFGFRSLWAMGLMVLMMLNMLRSRIPLEERALHEHFGKEWDAYRRTRWRFIPFIY